MGLGLWVYCGVRVLWSFAFNAVLIWKLEQADCDPLGSCDISGSLRFVDYRIFRKRYITRAWHQMKVASSEAEYCP